MNDLVSVQRANDWARLKTLVLDSVSSPITRRVYNMALDEFFAWYSLEPRPGFHQSHGASMAGLARSERSRLVVNNHPHVGNPQTGEGGRG